jgi:drug/metabolite transporter (DMT)-like permease
VKGLDENNGRYAMQDYKGEKAQAQLLENTENPHVPVDVAAFAAAGLALLLWSGTAIANKIAVIYIDGLSAGVLRSVLAGMIGATIAFALRLPFPKSGRDIAILAVSGLCSFALWPALLSIGIEFTTASHAALIMALIPIFTVLILSVIEGRTPHIGWWIGSAIAVGGAVSLVILRVDSLDYSSSGASLFGDLIILLGCVACSIGYVAGGSLSRKLGTIATTFWGLTVTLVVVIPLFAAFSYRTAWGSIPLEGWLALAWMTLLSSFAGYVLWFYALGRGGIRRIGTLQLALPLVTLALAVLLLNETLTAVLATTCVAIVSGTYLAHRHSG